MIRTIHYLLFTFFASILTVCHAQNNIEYGPELPNENQTVNALFGSDENGFYCQRLSTAGSGFTYVIEKYDKKTMKLIFAKTLAPIDGNLVRLGDILYANGYVHIIKSTFDKKAKRILVTDELLSAAGELSSTPLVLLSESAKSAECKIKRQINPSTTKLCVVVSFDNGDKNPIFKSILINLATKQIISSKSLPPLKDAATQKLWGVCVTKLLIDDKDNLYLAYSYTAREARIFNRVNISLVEAASTTSTDLSIDMPNGYGLHLNAKGDLFITSLNPDQEKIPGIVFTCIKVNPKTKTVVSQNSTPITQQQLCLKKDYLIAFEIKDIFSTADQSFIVAHALTTYAGGAPSAIASSFVIKLNEEGAYKGLTLLPVRAGVETNGYIFYNYAFTNKKLFALHNETEATWNLIQKPNADFTELYRNPIGARGSSLILTSYDYADGKVTNTFVLKNDPFVWGAMSFLGCTYLSEGTQNAAKDGKNFFIHTNKGELSKFVKIKLEQ